MKTDFTPYLE
jgi:importin-5